MSGSIDRRNFLKMMGWGGVGTTLAGCDLPTTVTLEEGKEDVVSYLMPEEYVIPGVGVWYASTCGQCAGGCGTHGRVREGRVLKLEGNPDSPINHGKLCMMGQAGLQGHYNPDRVITPMLREGGGLVKTTWEKALAKIAEKTGSVAGDKIAWFTHTISGHQSALLGNHLQALGANKHYVHEVVSNAVWKAVNKDVLGESIPKLRMDKAQVILSFGADFLGSWMSSPVHFAGQYAKFRTQAQRGVLIQIEPKMSLTGGNADLWLAVEPGSEAIVALGIANALVTSHNKDVSGLPDSVKTLINQYDAATVSKQTGVSADKIAKIAALLVKRSPSLVLAGNTVEGQKDGYQATAAIMLLNQLLGNIGQTIESAGTFPFEQLAAKSGNTADLLAFNEAANAGQLDVVFFYGSNPVYTAPNALALDKSLAKVGFKVALSQFRDETTELADVVLPLSSYVEDWGTHVAPYQAEQTAISMQQPLMEAIYPETKGFGDIVLNLLKLAKQDEYKQYNDYYAYLRHAYSTMPAEYKPVGANEEQAWQAALQTGVVPVSVVPVNNTAGSLSANPIEIKAPGMDSANAQYPYHLVPSARLGLWDGRHANLPWLQEAPDQISKLVWNSWAEIHPVTADKLGIKHGDIIKVASEHGEVSLQAVLLKSVHRSVIAIPMGQGHESYGRYAKGLGVNPLKLLSPTKETTTGELAMYTTRVKVATTDETATVVRMGSSDTQMGRKFVNTISVEQLRRTEGA